MVDSTDWRLTHAPAFLTHACLRFQTYAKHSATWDHEHCVLCWQKIAEPDLPGAVHEAYVVMARDEWICPACFHALADHFGWTLEHSSDVPGA